ncbi:MAG: 2-oxoglutarate dehydrogenase complex dihydrolipoyllysine-residue succinyltransferase [Bacteroidales bacterium]|nr:2-oxoglutarate dehydrogenase complex dihydrolipoyllysine-residue succinyltransferase [Bacteroidales bacterium]
MIIDIKIPSPGESITEVEIATWFVNEGDFVEKDQELAEIESEKATLPLLAEDSGEVSALMPTGEAIAVGTIACKIDTSKVGTKKEITENKEQKIEESGKPSLKADVPEKKEAVGENKNVKVSPLAAKLMEEKNFSIDDILNGLKRISKNDVELAISGLTNTLENKSTGMTSKKSRDSESIKMSQLRRKLGERLVSVKNETAMLTTFNEVDVSEIIRLRKSYQKQFQEKHGVKLGFMSFFTKAASLALKEFPQVNSIIDGDNFIRFNYSDIGIAVQTGKGLMVPVIRNAESLSLADIEHEIMNLANKARINRISIEDMVGGTFTITNGGVFGSMLSTPILNPPQAAILGMHNIVERPVAINGKVEIRPIMYLALSYDHRIIDGKDSVGFLVKIKELIENPLQMLMSTGNPDNNLLNI